MDEIVGPFPVSAIFLSYVGRGDTGRKKYSVHEITVYSQNVGTRRFEKYLMKDGRMFYKQNGYVIEYRFFMSPDANNKLAKDFKRLTNSLTYTRTVELDQTAQLKKIKWMDNLGKVRGKCEHKIIFLTDHDGNATEFDPDFKKKVILEYLY